MEGRDSTVTFELWLWFLAFLYGVAGVGGGVVITSESVDGKLFLISAKISSTWFISISDSFVASEVSILDTFEICYFTENNCVNSWSDKCLKNYETWPEVNSLW